MKHNSASRFGLGSSQELYSLYAKKRSEYINQKAQITDKALSEKLLEAALYTDLCMATYTDAIGILARLVQRQSHNWGNDIQRITNSLEESDKRILKLAGNSLSPAALEAIQFYIELREYNISQINVNNAANNIVSQSYDVAIAIIDSSIRTLFRLSDSRTAMAVITTILKNLAAFDPRVHVVLALKDINEALRVRQNRLAIANEVLEGIDGFVFAYYQWCIYVQVLIDSLEAELNLVSSTEGLLANALEGASKRVNERFKRILESIKSTNKDS